MRRRRPLAGALVTLLLGGAALASVAVSLAKKADHRPVEPIAAPEDSADASMDSAEAREDPESSRTDSSPAPEDSTPASTDVPVSPTDSADASRDSTIPPRDTAAGAPDTGETGAGAVPPIAPAPSRASASGIWIDRAEVMRRPMSGPEWAELLADAARSTRSPNISYQHSNHDVHTLAAALVCVRAGLYCEEARDAVVRAIGTEEGGRWIAVGRNLGAYVIAADLLGLRAAETVAPEGALVEAWIAGWLTKRLRDNIRPRLRPFGPFHSGANAAAQEGFAYAAVAAYLGDRRALDRAWEAYRTFLCDRSAQDREDINLRPPVRDGWAHDEESPCAVNPLGTTKEVPAGERGSGSVHRIDGALVADMRRGGTYRWAPGYTQYPWVGLEGLVPAAVVLQRAGYPAFEIADQAVLRAVDYLWYLRSATGDERWFDGVRAREIIHLVNVVYGASYPIHRTIGGGRTVGYTSWTHP